MKSKQDFILDTLRGYFQDPSTCAIEDGKCRYRTADGRKCALGQHIRDDAYDVKMEGTSAQSLLDTGQSCLTEEAQEQNLTPREWQSVQGAHDAMNGNTEEYILRSINHVEDETNVDLTELKQLYETHTH